LKRVKETVAVVRIFHDLARTYFQRVRRIRLANRIRRSASKASLGPQFRSVEIADPRMVVFVFEPGPNAGQADRSELVLTFVERLAKPRTTVT
jgi:hypothetical protein